MNSMLLHHHGPLPLTRPFELPQVARLKEVVNNMDFWEDIDFVPPPDLRRPISVGVLNSLSNTNTVDIAHGMEVKFRKSDTMLLWICWPGYKVHEVKIPVGPPEGKQGEAKQEQHLNRAIVLGRLMIFVGWALGNFIKKARTTSIDPGCHNWSIRENPHIFNEDTIVPVGLKRLGGNQFQIHAAPNDILVLSLFLGSTSVGKVVQFLTHPGTISAGTQPKPPTSRQTHSNVTGSLKGGREEHSGSLSSVGRRAEVPPERITHGSPLPEDAPWEE
ncbi:hypothetical protein BD413DRAFT_490752 [Trametes elegans]|nr:hypothetical protein BD413DRAFT_490752 [Trametes elegans]